MKYHRFSLSCLAAALALVAVAVTPSLRAAPEKAEAPVSASTNATPVFSLSVFDLTGSQVKDPFYPHSTRRTTAAAATNTTAVVSASSFRLGALSGGADQRLALINNRTLARGESAEVTTPSGNLVKIRLLEIRPDNSVLIHVENQPDPVELRFEDRSNTRIKLQY